MHSQTFRHLFRFDSCKLYSCTFLMAVIIGGCTVHHDIHNNHAAFLSQQAFRMNAQSEVIPTEAYALQTLHKLSGRQKTLRVYIEGDGMAWATRNRPSLDPTPINPLVLNLMALDSYSDAAYIARPCQYIKESGCNVRVWTAERYSWAAVNSISAVLDKLKYRKHYQHLELIGYSGGATLALIVAAHRNDVRLVRTIAGNLDPHYVNNLHRVTPMPDALTPVHYLERLRTVPQQHLIGADDRVIPPEVFSAYRSKFDDTECIEGRVISGINHQQGWQQRWQELLVLLPPDCHAKTSD